MAFVIRRDRLYEGTIISIEIISGFYYKSVRTKTGVFDGGQTTWIVFQRFYATLERARERNKKKESHGCFFALTDSQANVTKIKRASPLELRVCLLSFCTHLSWDWKRAALKGSQWHEMATGQIHFQRFAYKKDDRIKTSQERVIDRRSDVEGKALDLRSYALTCSYDI